MTTRGHHGILLAGGGGGGFATLNPADKGANLVLSGGNLTVKHNTSGWQSVRANVGKNSGKWSFEITQDAFGTGGSLILGLALSAASLSTYIGANANGWGFQPSATPQPFTYHNGSSTSVPGYPNLTVGQKVLVAVDITAGKMWCRTTGAAGWARGGDPALGTTPTISFTPGATVFPAISCNDTPQQATANFGQSPFSMTVPSGFSTGW